MSAPDTRALLGVDPGRQKCGLAVVSAGGAVLARKIVPTPDLAAIAKAWAKQWSARELVMGHGTGSAALLKSLRAEGLPVVMVAEQNTTLEARELYFSDNPPRGWRRLIPLGLQTPAVPLDDYAAVLIARRYLAQERSAGEVNGVAGISERE